MKKKLTIILVGIMLILNIGCGSDYKKGDITEIKILKVREFTETKIVFENDSVQYYFNTDWFENPDIMVKISKENIKEGTVIKITFSYYKCTYNNRIKNYEILK